MAVRMRLRCVALELLSDFNWSCNTFHSSNSPPLPKLFLAKHTLNPLFIHEWEKKEVQRTTSLPHRSTAVTMDSTHHRCLSFVHNTSTAAISVRLSDLGSKPLDNHLCNTLSTQRLAPHESLALEPSNKIADCRKHQHNRRGDQARGMSDNAKPLDQTHGTVDSCTHVVGGEASDEVVKGG